MDKAFISFRIGIPLWTEEAAFRTLMELFQRYPDATDDLVFFTSDTHPPLPVDVVHRRADLLRDRMPRVREAGYGVGINVLATLGHLDENLPNTLSDDYARMMDLSGNIGRGTLCPNSPSTHAYVSEIYRAFALAGPDYIWVDDDVRLVGHMPVAAGCFCDTCLKAFSETYGTEYSRESLRAALSDAPMDEKLRVRRAWLEHNRTTMRKLLSLIERTVHSVDPKMPLGMMTGDRFFEGYGFTDWAEALSGPDGVEVLWRPGGGFYSDEAMSALAGKSHDIGRQVSTLPDNVVRIQSEIENFPYQLLKKCPRTTALEAASHIAAGCTGAAFNVLNYSPITDPDTLANEQEPMVSKLAAARPFYDLLVSTLGRSTPQGIHTGWDANTYVANNLQGDWFGDYTVWQATSVGSEMLEIGLPAAYRSDAAQVTLLSGDSVVALDEDRIIRILSSGVYLDAAALSRLHDMGYGELTGFRAVDSVTVDAIEELTESPINGKQMGRQRDCRQSFPGWLRPAAVLEPMDERVQVLARLTNYSGDTLGSCCMGVFENRLGGRVCAAGYYPWTYLQSFSKSTQIKSVMRWLSRDTIPAYVASFDRANCWARDVGGAAPAVVVTNASIDTASITLAVRTSCDYLWVHDMQCGQEGVTAVGTDGPYKLFDLPEIGPWEMRLVTA